MSTGTFEYQSEYARRYFGRGKAEGRVEGRNEGRTEGVAKALLAFLAARGFDVPEEARTRIIECSDLDLLDLWVHRAATANSVDEIFD